MNKPPGFLAKKTDIVAEKLAKAIDPVAGKQLRGLEEKLCSPKNLPNFRTTSAATCFMSLCLGEMIAIKNNKNMPEDKKNYLIPQSAAEGVLIAASTLGIGKALEKGASGLVKKGLIQSEELQDVFKKNKGKIGDILSQTEHSKVSTLIDKKSFESLHKLHNGVKTVAVSLIALPLTINAIAPMLTNSFAKAYRKHIGGAKAVKKEPEITRLDTSLTATPISPRNTFGSVDKTYAKSQKISNLYNNFNSMSYGKLKI